MNKARAPPLIEDDMEHQCYGDQFFLRLEPGEEIIATLRDFATAHDRDFFAICSGVGMVEGLKLGFFCVNDNDYDTHTLSGVLDLSSICGNISKRGGLWAPHVHMVLNRGDFSTISGHVISAKAHITMELWLTGLRQTGITRQTAPGRPASFLTAG